MYRLKYNKVIFLVNISLHEYSSSFVFTQNLKNTLETTKWAFERVCDYFCKLIFL